MEKTNQMRIAKLFDIFEITYLYLIYRIGSN